MPNILVRGLLTGCLTWELVGDCAIQCRKTGFNCDLEFLSSPSLNENARKLNLVKGSISKEGASLATVEGRWDSKVLAKFSEESDSEVLLDNNAQFRGQCLRRREVPQDELVPITPGNFCDSEAAWKSTSQAILVGNFQLADERRSAIEGTTGTSATPIFFDPDNDNEVGQESWRYKHCDLRAWDDEDGYVYEKQGVVSTMLLKDLKRNFRGASVSGQRLDSVGRMSEIMPSKVRIKIFNIYVHDLKMIT